MEALVTYFDADVADHTAYDILVPPARPSSLLIR
jgi:hypothetical protein